MARKRFNTQQDDNTEWEQKPTKPVKTLLPTRGRGVFFFWFIFRDIYSFGSFLFSLSKHDDKLMGNLLVIICAIARAYLRLHTTVEIIISSTYLNNLVCYRNV